MEKEKRKKIHDLVDQIIDLIEPEKDDKVKDDHTPV